jgi:glycosyltransferase involved in cell wall biosynthesis
VLSRVGIVELMSPTISAIVPTYRRADVVARAVRSALAQTIAPIEVIVVDDEPSDAARTAVAAVGDQRVRYVPHETNRGLSAARNTAIRQARGDLVAFLDDDDEWTPPKLERQLVAMERADAPVVVTSFEQWVRPEGSVRVRDLRLDGEVLQTLLATDMVHMQTLLVPRAAFDDVGYFDEQLFHHEDLDMAIRLARRYRFVTVPEALTTIYVTPDSLSRNVTNRIAALERIIDKHVEYRCHRRLRSRLLARLGRLHAENGDAVAWRCCMREAVRLSPANVRAWMMLTAGSVFGPQVNVRVSSGWNRLARGVRRVRSPRR